MVEILRSPVTIHVTCNGSYGRHQLRENKMRVHCIRCKLNFVSANGKSNRKHSLRHGLNKLPIDEIVGCWNGVQGMSIPGVNWAFGSTRTNVNMFIFAGFEYGLVCEEEEDAKLSQKGEEEMDIVSYEQVLPPWGNVESRDDCIVQPIECSPPSNCGRVGSILEPRLHILEERDEEILSKRMLRLSRSNKVRSALELYMSMKVSGLQPNLHAYNSLLSCLLRNGLLNDALKVFEMMKEEMATGHTYSLILKAIAFTQGCDSALKFFMELEGEGTLKSGFDVIVYNTMISVCGKTNNWIQIERMWRNLKEDGHRATVVTYRLLVSTFVRCGQPALAFDAYIEMVQSGLKPSEDVMKAMISACIKERTWRLALGFFQDMLNSGLNPNIIAYNALINSLGKAGEIKLAFRVFDLLRSSGHTPDVYTWNALLVALYRGNKCADALRLFQHINREKTFRLNPHLCNTALMSCQKLGLWDRSLQLLWQMEASGLSVSTASYNLVIGACEVARKPKVALQAYEHMVHKKCIPNTFTYLSLIRACIWGSLWSEVEEILNHVTPDVSIYNAVIHGMCLRGKITSAKKLYTQMCKSGLQPDDKTRAFMLQILAKDSVTQNRRHHSRRTCR